MYICDAAHAIGTKYNGKPEGSIADLTCFSFHPVKTITSGEGGAITTNDYGLYHKLRLASQHGIVRNPDDFINRNPKGIWYYEMQTLGYNYRMTDFQAALLLCQLDKLDQYSFRRKEIAKMYDEAFAGMPEIIVQREIPESDTTRHLYIIRLDFEKLTCTRRDFFDAMSAENVQCQVHYVPVYWFPFYEKMGYTRGLCPIAEKIYEGIMSIPLYPRMSDYDANSVISAVKKVINYYKK